MDRLLRDSLPLLMHSFVENFKLHLLIETNVWNSSRKEEKLSKYCHYNSFWATRYKAEVSWTTVFSFHPVSSRANFFFGSRPIPRPVKPSTSRPAYTNKLDYSKVVPGWLSAISARTMLICFDAASSLHEHGNDALMRSCLHWHADAFRCVLEWQVGGWCGNSGHITLWRC